MAYVRCAELSDTGG